MKHVLAAVALVLLPLLGHAAAAAPPAAAAAAQTEWDGKMRPIVPRHYVCLRAGGPVRVDGTADEPAWADAPWTDDFVDIEGPAAKPLPSLRTRAKLLWDDQYLYVYAELQEPHVWGTITRRNEVIFRDNDFEVFVNPDGDNHHYYEFEVNALNTVWELTLDRPYRDNGPVRLGTNLDGLKSAVHVEGTLNDPADEDRGWSVEVAFPWRGLATFATKTSCPPKDGDQWRVGFSRVEWQTQNVGGKYQKVEGKPEDNWVWSPQGVIDMHRPERWGYVQFSTATRGAAAFHPDPTAPARDALMGVYYGQREFRKRNGRYARSLDELEPKPQPAPRDVPPLRMVSDGTGYVASADLADAAGPAARRVLHVRQDSRIWADENASPAQPIEMTEGVAVARVARGGRSAIPVDPVLARVARGEFTAPKDGEPLVVPGGRPATWHAIKADPDGGFAGPALAGGAYLYWPVNAPADCVMLLEAAGDGAAWVNGAPRAGDPYGYGSLRLPVALHAGANDLLFSVGRGRFRAKLLPPRQPVLLDAADPTLPDLLTDDKGTLWGAVVVANATDQPLERLRMHARFGALDAGEVTDLPAVPPLTIRKVPFRIRVPAQRPQDAADLALELLGPGGPLDTASVTLRVRKPTDVHKRTFVSRIDGSVQYYAVNPAQKPAAANALVLTLHGASVEALGQASAYASKDWATLVAPTNRRPYGFDWEDLGERDALEVLALAKQTIPHDPRRVILTGHSMGGHGTWHIGLTHPDLFAAIGPSAGWSSFTSYVSRRAAGAAAGAPAAQPDPVRQLFARAASTSDTPALVSNALPQEVYVLHGSADDNVPVGEARLMRQALDEIRHPRFSYHEQPGAGHWWGNLCVDWPPMFAMFDEARLPEPGKVGRIDFVTMNPALSGTCDGVTVEQQVEPMRPSRVRLSREGERVRGTAENVRTLRIDRAALGGPLNALELDGQDVELGNRTSPDSPLVVARQPDGRWKAIDRLDPRQKNARRGGPFKLAYDNRLTLVYGTHGSAQDREDAYNAARLFAEALYYRGNGAADCLPDVAFDAKQSAGRNVILFGNADSNAAWAHLLAACPVQVRNGSAKVGDRTVAGADLAALLVYPRRGSNDALVAAVAWSGHAGARTADALPLLVSGVGFPDWMIVGADCLTKGTEGVRGAGFFAADWSLDGRETVWGGQASGPPAP